MLRKKVIGDIYFLISERREEIFHTFFLSPIAFYLFFKNLFTNAQKFGIIYDEEKFLTNFIKSEEKAMMNIPRPEHPRPDFLRNDWINLNGEWEFHEDYSRSGRARKLYHADAALDQKITVPFCRESVLSGLGHTDFCECVWYRRALTLPEGWNNGSDRDRKSVV